MENKLRLSSLVLAFLGLLDSIYLVWVKYTGRYALCGPIGNCESVNTSSYSEILGVPIALLGAGAYLVIMLLLIMENISSLWAEFSNMIVFGISLVGVIYSIYLTYIEVAVLEAFCPYCVISAVILVVLFILSTKRLLDNLDEPSE